MPTSNLPPPPVPQELRELLKDYPEYLQAIQRALDNVVARPSKATPPFEMAVWMLEGVLGGFVADAYDELNAAEAGGDPIAIRKAKEKESAVGYARLNMGPMQDLFDYFEVHKEAFE